MFKKDETGEASLDAVKLISRMVKSKGYLIHESVINTFLHLRLKDELPPVADKDDENMKGKKRPKSNRPHISKKQRKVMKENKEVEKEMKEAEEVVTKEEKDKTVSTFLAELTAMYWAYCSNWCFSIAHWNTQAGVCLLFPCS